jgi:hypothetical protein
MHPSVAPDLRYPIGRFSPPSPARSGDAQARADAISAIAHLPDRLQEALSGLTTAQQDTPYREGGWTLRQLAHHVADSHIHAYTRLHFALTEDWPTIKPYQEALWAELPDARTLPIDISLALLVPLHQRWITLLTSLEDQAWTERGYMHPENGRTSLAEMTALYSWHGRHHTAHALELRKRRGW